RGGPAPTNRSRSGWFREAASTTVEHMLADINDASVRPLAVAYMVVRATMTAADEMELRRELVEFAADHGYRLSGTFVERDQGRSIEAFAGMLDALQKNDVT